MGGYYSISAAAELAGVHPQTLRAYERHGLLEPARSAGNTRRYSEADIERLRRIRELTAIGLNIAGVRLVLQLDVEVGRLLSEVARLHDEVVAGERRMSDAVAAAHSEHRRELVRVQKFLPVPKRHA